MKGIVKTLTACLVAAIMMQAVAMDAEATGRGRGQTLRDGSGAGSASQWQGNYGSRDCTTANCNLSGTRGGYGDGTHPRPMDGTGFGKKR